MYDLIVLASPIQTLTLHSHLVLPPWSTPKPRYTVPSVQKIVYSTCSIHAIENEHVVLTALNSPEAKSGPFSLSPRTAVLPAWPRRGQADILPSPGTFTRHTVPPNPLPHSLDLYQIGAHR